MAKEDFTVKLEGDKKLFAKMARFPTQAKRGMEFAGREYGTLIIKQKGLSSYPPSTAANQPPVPYYIRNVGTQTASGNLRNSEVYGKRFTIKPKGYITTVDNTASYAKYLSGVGTQARAMKRIGWRIMFDVANEQIKKGVIIYDKWVGITLRKLGLR